MLQSTLFIYLLILVFLILIIDAQDIGFDPSVDHFDTHAVLNKGKPKKKKKRVELIFILFYSFGVDLDSLFSVEYHHWYKVVTNHAANQKYALVCCGQDTSHPDLINQHYDAIINIPVKAVGIDGAFNVLPFLELLQLQDTVQYINGYENVTSPCYQHLPRESQDLDMMFVSNDATASMEKNAAVVFSANDNQLTPLAVSLFIKKKKRMKIILVVPSDPLQFHQDIHHADIVIDQTDFSKNLVNTDATYEDWLDAGEFIAGTVSFDQPFIHHNTLYRVDGLVDEKGFLDWTQRAAARPDLVLTDMIHLSYPLYNRSYQYVWLRNFAKMDHSRVITPSTYSCVKPSMASLETCSLRRDLFPENDASSSFRHPGNVGLILGILATCGLTVAAIVLYRNWRNQTKIEYFPLTNF
ncbi:uncharacterized protein BX664DRAFT_265131 [Halteromyces radiatus]|uniref:uncharacterized protein n=1 Tax=Halteromyces radiatus TaxID=101107 RepID=UPI002220443E|nr:uncharacterized protein BX664DRAFT_265131 [Halteromyces radiatus]KAI8086547.1 hypothetical protein BX664DRAFT_265131 [Halteromyces radiatus]